MDYLAFTGDAILFAEDKVNLQGRLANLVSQLEHIGLSINSTNSSCVNTVAEGRRKITMLDHRPVATSSVSSLSATDNLKFLVVPFNWKGKLPTAVLKNLDRMLREILVVPL
ncbi:hypothetical protein EG68_11285 [Paragonimus skrjabini miyazakii]|uniref:Reverse transcriptase domain-containing protein n=1 Tax=Paragonimus skrjabini miyazakii TaxID=59628 RepID=A0A8S9YL78_9TREM|nr:hypothetical protein EG68_11285 [Paragonimus skrjabini miyazakii]